MRMVIALSRLPFVCWDSFQRDSLLTSTSFRHLSMLLPLKLALVGFVLLCNASEFVQLKNSPITTEISKPVSRSRGTHTADKREFCQHLRDHLDKH